jgi:hypothetical protein
VAAFGGDASTGSGWGTGVGPGAGEGGGGTAWAKHWMTPFDCSWQQMPGAPAGACQPGGQASHCGVGGGGGGHGCGGGQSQGGQFPPGGQGGHAQPVPLHPVDAVVSHTPSGPAPLWQHVPGEPGGWYQPTGHGYTHPLPPPGPPEPAPASAVPTGGAAHSPDPSSGQQERGSGYVV